MNERSSRLSAFLLFECLETLMKHEARAYEMASPKGLIANEPAERRRSAGEAAENSAARRMVYAKKFSIGIEKCKCKV